MLDLGNMTLFQGEAESRENDSSIHNIDMALVYCLFYLANILTVLSLPIIVTDVSNVGIRLVIRRHNSVLLIRFKTKGIVEIIHHALDIGLEAPCKNLIIGLRLLDSLKVAAKEIFRVRCLLNGEALSLDQVKYIFRILFKNNQVITILCHV